MKRADFRTLLESRVLFFDGAYGTEFFKRGRRGVVETLNITEPKVVKNLQSEYAESGADIILTNTFSANRAKLESHGLGAECEAINASAVEIARASCGRSMVFGDISSTGKLLEPLGSFGFEEAFGVFREQAAMLVESGVDGIIVETMSDIKELKAAILAVRDVSADIPLIAQMTFERNGNSVTGTSVEIFAAVVNDLDVDAAGVNCSLSPGEMFPVFQRLAKSCRLPLCVEPNAGSPKFLEEKLNYGVTPEEFAVHAADFAEAGANIIGGCCGVGPEHIRAMSQYLGNLKPRMREFIPGRFLASRTLLKPVDPFLVIGERINASGKKDMQERIQKKDFAFLAALAQDQEREGASIVDVNFGIEKLLDKDCIRAALNELDRRSSPPVAFDIQGFDFLDAAMREHPGVGLVNSSFAREDHLSPRLGLLKKYGGMLVVLAMEKDIPETAEGRFAAVKRVVEIIGEHGVGLDRVFFDPLVLPAGAGKDWRATLETLRLIQSAGLRSCVGLSNLSFGMPARDGVNAAFLSLCIDEGLGGAIMNTFEETAMKVLRGSLVLRSADMPEPQSLCGNSLVKSIVQGRSDEVFAIVKEELENHDPLHVSQNVLAVAMKEVGTRYSKGSIFLPHLIMAAETVEPIFEYLNGLVGGEGIKKRGKVLLATVEGDIHDIGKKIVATVLRSGMFEVVDLGKDAPAKRIVAECAKHKPDVVGLSAMMTTTVGQVKDVADLLRAECIDVPVIAGGASMNADLAERFGVLWGKDAIGALSLCGELAESMKQVNENFPRGEPNEECS